MCYAIYHAGEMPKESFQPTKFGSTGDYSFSLLQSNVFWDTFHVFYKFALLS